MFKAFVPGEGRSKSRCAVNWIFLIAGIALAGAALTWIVSYILHAVRTGMDWAAVADDLIPNVVKTKNELSKCFVQTVQMVLFSSLISAGFGILFGVLLVVTQKGGILECPPVFQTLDKVINVFRSIPFIILVALLIKTTRNLVGTSIGVTGAVFPLVVAVCHAACALTSINGLISIATGFDVSNALTATVCFVVVLYGGYYLLTYQTSKAMVLRPAMR